MDTITKSEQTNQIVYVFAPESATETVTIQKTNDGSLHYSIDINLSADYIPTPETWSDFCAALENGVHIKVV